MVAASIIFLGAGTGRAVLDREPVRDRRRLRRRRDQPRRRDRPAARSCGSCSSPWRSATSSGTRAGCARTRRRSVVGISPTDAEDAQRPDRRRAGAHRAPEARPAPLRGRVPGHDLRLHPVERPVAGGLGHGLPAADVRVVLLPRGGGAVLRHGGRDRPDRQARRGGHGQHDHRRAPPTSSPPR